MTGSLTRFRVELRSEIKKGRKLEGHASVFGQGAQQPGHVEMIAPTAFKRVLENPATDVRALFNHDPSLLLGRQSSGTLRLSTDSQGLPFEIDLPDTTVGRDVQVLAERGDLTGASFAFIPDEDEWETRDGVRVRTHTSIGSLLDVSPVTYPAYAGADVVLRSIDFSKLTLVTKREQLIRARARIHHGRV